MYTFKVINGHLIADVAGKLCLVDTGSPVSFGEGDIQINKTEFELQSNGFGVTIDTIASDVETPIQALIGADIFTRCGGLFVWNYKSELYFSTKIHDKETSITLKHGIPIIRCMVDGKEINACIDTGAQHSYVNKDLSLHHEMVGQVADFYPTLGSFTANTVSLSITDPQSQAVSTHCFAVLPDNLVNLLNLVDCQAILGLDWLMKDKSHFQIDYINKTFSNY